MHHPGLGSFPATRMRRNRQHPWLRAIVAETVLTPADLLWPMFVHDHDAAAPIAAMPGVERLPIDGIVRAAAEAARLGIPAIALFPATDPARKTVDGSHAVDPENLVCRTVRAVRRETGDAVGIICDVALDPYTTHGHDGLLVDGRIVNDETVAVLCRQSLVLAEAGCHVVAPSDMMDGRVGAIRTALDAAGRHDVGILSYAAKYASAFYGPFREAAESAPQFGDRRSYQMDPANAAEALREVALDVAEGADMIMVKPALSYLDVIRRVRDDFPGIPLAAYNVSGEYAMIKAAAARGWIDEARVVREVLTSIKRAGADMILTYFAKDIATAATPNS